MAGIDPKNGLLIALGAFALFYLTVVWGAVAKAVGEGETFKNLFAGPRAGWLYFTGAFTNFWDTIGVGSFATTTAIYRKWKLVPDERIPGTLNIGHTLPTIAQAFLFTKLVPVDPMTLTLMILAAAAGSFVGSGIVADWPRRKVQMGMGLALLAAAVLMGLSAAHLLPGGGDLLKLEGGKLILGMAGNFVLGSLMTIGIGLYAPCMVLIYLLGMTPTAAFPIMMGSCAFLMPVASARFVKKASFDLRATLALAIGGVPLVFIAAPIVANPKALDTLKFVVVAVVLYTSYGMLRSAFADRGPAKDPLAGGKLSVAE